MGYDVIYADPAWAYRNAKTGGSHVSGAAQKYPTLSVADIASLPVKQIASKDAVCFLWSTVPLGADPYDVLKAWGFEYKTRWFWHKAGTMGTGYWTRGNVEEVLIGVRGKVPAWRSSLSNWIEALDQPDTITTKPEGHSQKPEVVIRRIEALTINAGRRCELFATTHSAEVAARSSDYALNSPWECFGLDLGHNFLDPTFWEGLRAQARMPEPVAEHPSLADA